MLRQLLKESGVRDPLLVLSDGRVLDGVHRLELARALGLTEVPVRVVDVPEPCSENERMQLETTRAALDVGRRHIDPPHRRRLMLELTQAELQLRVVNRRVANLRHGRVAGSGSTVPTQRERGRAVGMSERAVRRLDRIARLAPPDVLDAVRAGKLSVKSADRRLARPGVGHVPTGPVRAREAQPASSEGSDTTNPVVADGPRPIGAVPGQREEPGERRTNTLAGSPLPTPPAVKSFMAVCRALHEATKDFVRDTAHWTGERREQRNLTIWRGLRQLEEHLDWMEDAGEARPGAI